MMCTKKIALAGLTAFLLALPATASANVITNVLIKPSFKNNKLGAGTDGTFGVVVNTDDGLFPAPGQHALVHLPAGMEINTKPFEKITCSKEQIESRGANTCPKGAIIGGGDSLIGAVLGSQIVREHAKVTAFAGPREGGKPVLNIYADARSPVSAQIVLHGVLRKSTGGKQFGQMVDVDIPPIPTSPGSPDATILSFDVKIGGKKKVRSKKGKVTTEYLAKVPKKCPAGGFPWRGVFTFTDGEVVTSDTTTPCPKK